MGVDRRLDHGHLGSRAPDPYGPCGGPVDPVLVLAGKFVTNL